jgi:catalase
MTMIFIKHPQGLGFGDAGYNLSGNIERQDNAQVVAGRFDARGTEDDFTQAGNLYRLLPPDQQDRLTSNIAGAMASVSAEIKAR